MEDDLWICVLLLLLLLLEFPRCCWSCFWKKRERDLAEECHQKRVELLESHSDVQAADRPTAGAAKPAAKQMQESPNSPNAADRSTSSVDLRWRATPTSYRGNAGSKREHQHLASMQADRRSNRTAMMP